MAYLDSYGHSSKPIRSRRTRFVCVSDTHNHEVKIPKGDVLIHAGDLTNQGTFSELSKAIRWLEKTDFEAKIVIAGNHDISLDAEFYQQYGMYFHSQRLESPADCIELIQSSPSITYLCHNSAKIRLSSPTGPHTEFTVFGSPYSPRKGLWAFGSREPDSPSSPSDIPVHASSRLWPLQNKSSRPKEPASSFGPSASELWSAIPSLTDIVITHTPPRRHCDGTGTYRGSLGCETLRQALWRVRPRLAVCGHVHEGRGAETVRWDFEGGVQSLKGNFEETGVTLWEDQSGNGSKIALIDLARDLRKGRTGLENDGTVATVLSGADGTISRESQGNAEGHHDAMLKDIHPGITKGIPGSKEETTTPIGLLSGLVGGIGRRETCVVNCSIMKNSYPHVGGKKFNKPIVIDLDLPTWEEVLAD